MSAVSLPEEEGGRKSEKAREIQAQAEKARQELEEQSARPPKWRRFAKRNFRKPASGGENGRRKRKGIG